jgi:hypothetical protein
MAEKMVKASQVLDRVLVLEMVRVTEAAAVAASKLIGRGDEKAADHAAVEAMRVALNTLELDGTVVIGEGERDEAPMLYIGEKVGAAQGSGPRIDIALDPLAYVEHRRLVPLAFADDDGPVDMQIVERPAHRFHRGGVCGLFISAADQGRGRDCRRLRHPDHLEHEHPVEDTAG